MKNVKEPQAISEHTMQSSLNVKVFLNKNGISLKNLTPIVVHRAMLEQA
jgi:hypothetical protein